MWLELELLRDELAMLRRQLAGEVRTRRLVVVDERGFSRVVIDTLQRSGTVEVRGQTKHGQRFTCSLIASEESEQPVAGLYLREEVDEEPVVEIEARGHTGPIDGVASAHVSLGRPGAAAIHLGTYSTEAEVTLNAFDPLRNEDEQARVALHVAQGWTAEEGANDEPGLPVASVVVEGAKTTAISEDGEPV